MNNAKKKIIIIILLSVLSYVNLLQACDLPVIAEDNTRKTCCFDTCLNIDTNWKQISFQQEIEGFELDMIDNRQNRLFFFCNFNATMSYNLDSVLKVDSMRFQDGIIIESKLFKDGDSVSLLLYCEHLSIQLLLHINNISDQDYYTKQILNMIRKEE